MAQPPEIPKIDQSDNHLKLNEALLLGAHIESLRSFRFEEKVDKKEIVAALEDLEGLMESRTSAIATPQQIGRYRLKIENESGEVSTEELNQHALTWLNLFAQELSNEKRIPVSDSGILNVKGLIESPEKLFSELVWRWLDRQPRSDIVESCRALAVGCNTASVMLSLRAVEHCLRDWYEEDNEPIERAGWGRVLDQLMEEHATDEKRNDTVLSQLSDLPPILTNLYYLKEKRNEVNHPEKRPSAQEARRTLIIVSATISEIYEEMATDLKEAVNHAHHDAMMRMDPLIPDDEYEEEELIYHTVTNIVTHTGEAISRDLLYDLMKHYHLSEGDVDAHIQRLMMSGHLYEPSDGKLKFI